MLAATLASQVLPMVGRAQQKMTAWSYLEVLVQQQHAPEAI